VSEVPREEARAPGTSGSSRARDRITGSGASPVAPVPDEEVVDRAYDEVGRFDDVDDLDAEPTRSGWGYGFAFRDPEGNVWGVACKYGSDVDGYGRFVYP